MIWTLAINGWFFCPRRCRRLILDHLDKVPDELPRIDVHRVSIDDTEPKQT